MAEEQAALELESTETTSEDVSHETGTETETTQQDQSTETTETTEAPTWFNGIEDEKLQAHAKRFASPQDIVEAHLDLRKQLSKAIVPAGKDATDEQKAAFHKSMGVPEKAEDYKVELPEEVPEELAPDAETLQSYLETAHAAGATPEMVQNSVAWFYNFIAQGSQARARAEKEAIEGALSGLKKEFGGEEEFKRRANQAFRAAQKYGGDEFKEFLETHQADGIRLADHPAFIKPFAKIGARMSEHGIVVGMSPEETQNAQDKMKELTAQIWDANDSGDRIKVDKLSKERAALSERMSGTGPIVGGPGRTT